MNLGTVWAIALKDLRQSIRDRTLVIALITLPLMQLLLLAHATSGGATNLPIAVLDYDHSSESRALIALLDATDTLSIARYPATWDEGVQAIEVGEVFGLVIIPQGMAAAFYNPTKTATTQLIIDATTTIVARIVQGAVQQAIQRFIQQRGMELQAGVQVRPIMQYNPTVQSRPNSISAQVAMITYEITLAISALGFTREREVGTLEQLMVTPVRRHELLIGKALSPMLLGLLNFTVLYVVVRYIYHIPMRGSIFFLFGGSLLFITVEVMWGTFISTLSGTQQQAILVVFIQAMTDVALSGFLVPTQDMPPIFQFFANFSPLRYFLTFTRAVMLKGATLRDMLPNLLALLALGLFMGTLATIGLARSLD